jgi:hypothetical protein
MKRQLFVSILFSSFAVLLLTGCGDDNGGGPGSEEEAAVVRVLTDSIPAAVEARDASAYGSFLHPDYRFSFAEGDAPVDLPGASWGKTTDLAAVAGMFADTAVVLVRLDIAVLEGAFEAIPGMANERGYRASAVTGVAVVRAPGFQPLDTLLVSSIETFHLRVDPESGEWKVYDEVEHEAVGKSSPLSVGSATWGEVKALHHRPLDPPASRTVKGTIFLGEGGSPLAGAIVHAGSLADTTDSNGLFEMDGVPGNVAEISVEHPDALTGVIPVGGGDEVFRIDAALVPLTLHTGPGQMIETDFAQAYAAMDSARYASLLDSRYTFELLEEEPDPDFPEGWWDRAEELAIAGTMFKGRANPDGQTVRDIILDFQIKSSVVDNTSYPDKPEGEVWHRVAAVVDLRVIANDPCDPHGVMNYLVNSDQIFVVRPDPGHASRYLVYRQIDQPSINKAAGTQDESWTSVKLLWR